MPKIILCILENQSQAQTIIDRIEHAGIEPANISIAMGDQSERYGQEAPSPGLLDLLARTGKIVIRGSGFFLLAGPLLATLQETPKSILEGLAGALHHLGLPEFEANRIQDWVKTGKILVVFHVPDNDEAHRISEILHNTDAKDISVYGEEDLSDPRRFLSSLSG